MTSSSYPQKGRKKVLTPQSTKTPRRTSVEEVEQYYPLLDALFFSASAPLTIDQFRRALRVESRGRAFDIVEGYVEQFNSLHRGVKISETSRKVFLMHVNPEYVETIRRYMHPPPLTEMQLKILAYIYKNQPIQLNRVASIFGNRAYRDVKKLHKLRLVSRKKMGRGSLLTVREAAKHMIKTDHGSRKPP